jgi:HEAT repeat protein/cyclophilin family peptidyl-prolyl cis-trans isomerase
VATVAFSTGQLKDTGAVPWLAEILTSPGTPPAAAREAAGALGKIRSTEARAALAAYLTAAPVSEASRPVVGDALLAFGRFMPPGDVTPIVRWTSSPDPEVRWRAAWALFRPRDSAAVPHLLRLADDKSADVRFWAVRGLAPAAVTAAGLDPARAAARLRDAVRDPDRRVRTEALRALAAYDDDDSFATVLAALESPDSWLSVSSAEALGRFTARKDVVVPKLVAAAAPPRPLSVRLTALAALAALAPEPALDAASTLAREPGGVARTTALQVLRRLGAPGVARIEQLVTADASLKPLLPAQTSGPRPPRPAPPVRAESEYRQLVERWIAPDYKGTAKPRAILETPRGTVELELYPGDAPLGVDYFVKVVESGAIVGTEFGRVVPNFVAQQRPIRDEGTLRDEVNRHGLTRGNLSWASAGLDTGRPGYTLGSTPQPHNEGDFTALGRVVRGMDVVDRLELGDKITGARLLR